MRHRALFGTILILAAACGDPVSYRADDLVGSWRFTEHVQSVFYRDLEYAFGADGTYVTGVKLYQVPGEAPTTRPSSVIAGHYTTALDRLDLFPDSVTTWDGAQPTTETLGPSSFRSCTYGIRGDELTLVCPTDTGPTTLRLQRIS